MKKVCTKCEKEKNETAFPLTTIRGRLVRRSWCDSCMKNYYHEYHLAKLKKKRPGTARRQRVTVAAS